MEELKTQEKSSKKILDGYQNEFLFVLEFNNKKIKELNPMLREVVDELFPGYDEESIIKSWRNPSSIEKGDIFLKVNGHLRSISIKKGSRNSVHVESIEKFKRFLEWNNIDSKTIDDYVKFHYGMDNGNFLTSSEFNKKYPEKILNINKELLKIHPYIIVDRFILRGNSGQYYSVDGLIYGEPNDFLWINKYQIKEIVKRSLKRNSNSVHFGNLYIQSANRCFNNNYKNLWKKDYIQVKWYSLFDDIVEYKNSLIVKEKESIL